MWPVTSEHGGKVESGPLSKSMYTACSTQLTTGLAWATAPYFYGSILLRVLTSKIIVVLTYVSKKKILCN
jgi:hypothetical protein